MRTVLELKAKSSSDQIAFRKFDQFRKFSQIRSVWNTQKPRTAGFKFASFSDQIVLVIRYASFSISLGASPGLAVPAFGLVRALVIRSS